MNVAILAVSSLSLIASVSTLVIMARTKKGLEAYGAALRADIDQGKARASVALDKARAALNEMEL